MENVRLTNILKPITIEEAAKSEAWMPVKKVAKKLNVTIATVLNKIKRNVYEARTLFGRIVVNHDSVEKKEDI